MTLLIIRHGETPLNVARVLQPANTPLSARGLAQAAALARRLAAAAPAALRRQTADPAVLPRQTTDPTALPRQTADPAALPRPVAIVSSDLPRALQTAQAIAAACGLTVLTSTLLHERNFGQLRGLPYDSLGFDPLSSEAAAPGGESLSDFKARCRQAWAWVLAQHTALGGPMAVVTHGLVIRHWLHDGPLAVPGGMALPTGLANTSLTLVAGAAPHTVRLLGCTAHLVGGVGDDSASLSGG